MSSENDPALSSDTFVFERRADPARWAVIGRLMFTDCRSQRSDGKAAPELHSASGLSACRSWGVDVVGRSWQASERTIARRGGGDGCWPGSCRSASARQIWGFAPLPPPKRSRVAASLCDHPKDMLIAVRRDIRRWCDPRAFSHARPRAYAQAERAFIVPRSGRRGGGGRHGVKIS